MKLQKAIMVFTVYAVLVFIVLVIFELFMSGIIFASIGGKIILTIITMAIVLLVIATKEVTFSNENNDDLKI